MSSTRVIRRQQDINNLQLLPTNFTNVDEYPPDSGDTRTRLDTTQNPSNTRSSYVITSYDPSGGPKQGPVTKVAVFTYGYNVPSDSVYNISNDRRIIDFTPTRVEVETTISSVIRPGAETWKHHRLASPGTNTALVSSWQDWNYDVHTQTGGNSNGSSRLDPMVPNNFINVGNDVITVSPTTEQFGVDTKAGGILDLYNIASGEPSTTRTVTLGITTQYNGDLIIKWEGTNHSIDGLNGDTAPNIAITSTLTVDEVYVYDAEANPQASFTITEDSVSVITGVEATLSSNFSTSFTGNIKSDTTKTLSTQCELLATTENFTFAEASISSAFTQSQTPALIIDITKTLSSTTTQTVSAGLIYDIVGDYTWDSLTDTWNDWPFDTWTRPYNVNTVFTVDKTPSFIIGITNNPTSAFTLVENVALNEPGEATLSAIFSSSFTARGIIDQGSNITSNFSTTALANAVYDAIADFDGVLSAELIANLIIGSLLATPSSQFTLASSPTFKPGGEVDMSAAFEILDKLGNMIYDADASLSALYSELAVGSLYQSADFYNTFKVLQETRNILIAIENRQHIISEEKRLNTIKAESRNVLVPEETRRFKLKVAPITNRFTTPKVRSPQ